MKISCIPQQTHWEKLWPNLKLSQISSEDAHKSIKKNVECYKKLVRLKPRNLLTHNYWALNAWEPAVLNNQMLLWQCERVLGEGHPSLTLLPARQAAAVGWATWDVGYEGTATLARRRHGVANAVAHCCTARCLWHTSHPDEPSITLSTQHLATAIYPREEKAAASRRQFNTFVIAGADSRSCFHT